MVFDHMVGHGTDPIFHFVKKGCEIKCAETGKVSIFHCHFDERMKHLEQENKDELIFKIYFTMF